MRQKAHTRHITGIFISGFWGLNPPPQIFSLRVSKWGLICLSPQDRNRWDCPSAGSGARVRMPAHTVIERKKERMRVKRNTHRNAGQLAIADALLNAGILHARSSLLWKKKKNVGSHSRKKAPFSSRLGQHASQDVGLIAPTATSFFERKEIN